MLARRWGRAVAAQAAACCQQQPLSLWPAQRRWLSARRPARGGGGGGGSGRGAHGRSVARRSGGSGVADAPAPAEQQPAEGGGMYDRPQLYDDAFSYRNFATEAKFLLGAYQQHAQGGGKPQAALELGCGPANHAVQLAKRKVKAWALDLNGAMLRFAADKAAAAGVQVTTVQGDMTDFEIKGMEGRFDLVVCLLGTLSHMLDNKQAAACFRRVAQHLRPGGLFVVELAHPGDLFDGSLLLQDTGAEMWEVDRAGRKMMVVWGTDVDMFDPESQVIERTVRLHSMEGGEMGDCMLEEVVPYRHFTVQEIDLLATMAGMEVVGTYGDLDLGVSLTHEDAYRLLVCMRKL